MMPLDRRLLGRYRVSGTAPSSMSAESNPSKATIGAITTWHNLSANRSMEQNSSIGN